MIETFADLGLMWIGIMIAIKIGFIALMIIGTIVGILVEWLK